MSNSYHRNHHKVLAADPANEQKYLHAWIYRLMHPERDKEFFQRRKERVLKDSKRLAVRRRTNKRYYYSNRETCIASNRKWRKNNPSAMVADRLRSRVRVAVATGIENAYTSKYLGCSVADFRAHLQSLFKPGMTWENRGKVWHISHVIPCARYDLTKEENRHICFHYTNIQPEFAIVNKCKHSK